MGGGRHLGQEAPGVGHAEPEIVTQQIATFTGPVYPGKLGSASDFIFVQKNQLSESGGWADQASEVGVGVGGGGLTVCLHPDILASSCHHKVRKAAEWSSVFQEDDLKPPALTWMTA